MKSFDEALAHLLAVVQPVSEIRHVPLEAAAGRVLAADQSSTVAVPPLDNSAMDGYALRAEDVPVPGTQLPVSQRIPAGTVGSELQAGTAARIFTGAPIPPGADAVIMQERCEATASGVTIQQAVKAGDNIRRRGEDISVGACILEAGQKLRAQDVALAASAGLPELPVYRRIRVGVFFTGDELVQPGQPLPPGAIYNSNRFALRAQLEGLGCEVRDLGTVPDNLPATREAIRKAAAENDLIVTSGGVSVGEEDHVKPAVEAEGRLDLWTLAIKPGKPLAFGEVRKTGGHAWFIGLPGNPVSAFVTFVALVRPFILKMQGAKALTPRAYPVAADFDWSRPDPKRTEFFRARFNAAQRLELFPNQGSGVVTSLCWADGLVVNPPGQAIARGDTVSFLPFSELLA